MTVIRHSSPLGELLGARLRLARAKLGELRPRQTRVPATTEPTADVSAPKDDEKR